MSSGIWNAPRISCTRGSWFHQHFHHIESIRYSRVIQQSEPLLGAANDAILLGLGHSFVRRTECVGRACLNFNEYQRFFMAIAADQIDFAAPSRSEILVQQPKSISAADNRRPFFLPSVRASDEEPQSPASHSRPESNGKENTSEQPARTIVDGSGKVHGSVNFRGAPAFHSLCSGQNRIAETRYANSSSYGLG